MEGLFVLIPIGIVLLVGLGMPFSISYVSGRDEGDSEFRPEGEMWPWAYSLGYVSKRKQLYKQGSQPKVSKLEVRTMAKIAKFEGRDKENDY